MTERAEILAPCGSPESVLAAVRCGANAVYLGTQGFNARRGAKNFSEDELREAIRYCHSHGVKVHVALNTLVSDAEMPEALKALESIYRLGADAVIIQDVGLASLAKEAAPEIEMHASTQMSVQTAAGINLLGELGFSTAVLPRELSKSEIRSIASKTDMRLEAFVHGALCMSVSGQCLLSAFIGRRSGNRGLCAQPCRLPFSCGSKEGHNLSLKDLSLIKKAPELVGCGVSSLKIEGRMKRPEYVAAAVTALKNSLEGKTDEKIDAALSSVFSRSGFTDGYFEGKTGKAMFGIRTKDDVLSADKETLSSLRRLFDKETPLLPVSFRLKLKRNERVELQAECCGKTAFAVSGILPQDAISSPVTKEMLEEKLSKCGGTQFYAKETDIELDERLSVPLKEINTLRRNVLAELEEKLSETPHRRFATPELFPKRRSTERKAPALCLRFSDPDQIPDELDGVFSVIFPLGKAEEFIQRLRGKKVVSIVETPRGIFGSEDTVLQELSRAKELGIRCAMCMTADGISLAKKAGMTLFGGFSLNAFNSYGIRAFEQLGVGEITLSPELKLSSIKHLSSSLPTNVIAYGRLPLMLTRNCPVRIEKNCTECKGKSFLTDRMGIRFPVVCGDGCSELLNSKPIYLADVQDDICTDRITLYFTVETKEEVKAIIDAYRKKEKPYGDFTRGLYYRGVE